MRLGDSVPSNQQIRFAPQFSGELAGIFVKFNTSAPCDYLNKVVVVAAVVTVEHSKHP